MAEERADQNTEQESQDTLVETLVDKVLLHMQQKLQSQEGRAHASGSLSHCNPRVLEVRVKDVASPQLPEVVFRICKVGARSSQMGQLWFQKGDMEYRYGLDF